MDGIYNDLCNVGYDKTENNILIQSFNDGQPNAVFVNVVSWLSSQLCSICELENYVSSVDDECDESIGFQVEISSLLKELGCPFKVLTTGPVENRLKMKSSKILVITYLCSELQAAKMINQKKPKVKDTSLEVELSESKTAKELKEMLISLKFGKPPDNITPQMLFTEIEKKIKLLSQPAAPKDIIGELLFTGCLYEKQWFQLEELYKEMHREYKTRKSMLLTRLDVTIRSFLWSDRLKNKSEEVINIYNKQKNRLFDDPHVKISDILAAKLELASIDKTSNPIVRKNTKSTVNTVIIGSVPDRGGRPEEQQPPPPEIPSWQKNDSSSRGGRGAFSNQQSSNQRTSQSYKNPKDDFQDSRSYSNSQKSGNFIAAAGNYGGRNDYSANPVYQSQPPQYCPQMGNNQCGFGGYVTAGDNFQQYGMNDGYQPRPNSGSNIRGRGVYRGGSRPFRGPRYR